MSATVASLEREIREVGEEVRKVECKIDEVEQRIDCSDGKEKEQLRIKEEHATKEKGGTTKGKRPIATEDETAHWYAHVSQQ